MNYPYEYVSGVGRILNFAEIFLTNRSGTEAMGRALVYQGLGDQGIGPSQKIFDSGDEILPPGKGRLTISGPVSVDGGSGLYWARIFTTSADLLPTMWFYRGEVTEDTIIVPDFIWAPRDFAVFSPSSQPLPEPLPYLRIGPSSGPARLST